jgi:hypothetical protein
MAKILKTGPAHIGKFIEVNLQNTVVMTSPWLFHGCASKIANTQIEKQIAENDHGASPPKGGRSAQLKRPFDRKKVNLAIIEEDGTDTSNSDEAADAWQPACPKSWLKNT